MSAALQPLEELIYNGIIAIIGDATYIGVLILLFFGGIAVVLDTRLEFKIVIIIGASILALPFIPALFVPLVLISGILVFLAIIKIFMR